MKFHRVQSKLPAGVSPSVSVTYAPIDLDPGGNKFFSELSRRAFGVATRSEQTTSTEPVAISFDVPESAVTETARVLRAMADELEGKS